MRGGTTRKNGGNIPQDFPRRFLSLSKEFFFSKNSINSIYVLSFKSKSVFSQYFIGRRSGYKLYIYHHYKSLIASRRRLFHKRKGRTHQATNFVEPGPARRHENIIFGSYEGFPVPVSASYGKQKGVEEKCNYER